MTRLLLAIGLLLFSLVAYTYGDDSGAIGGDTALSGAAQPRRADAVLLVEEREDGKPGETVLVPTGQSEISYRITKALTVQGPSPFLSVGGRLGVETGEGLAELGIEAFVFWFPPNDGAVGIAGGAYAMLAPIPGNWGRRFYLQGKVYRSFALGLPTYDAVSLGVALGYRQPLGTPAPGSAKPRALFFEIGAEKAHLLKYDESIYMLDVLRAGLVW